VQSECAGALSDHGHGLLPWQKWSLIGDQVL